MRFKKLLLDLLVSAGMAAGVLGLIDYAQRNPQYYSTIAGTYKSLPTFSDAEIDKRISELESSLKAMERHIAPDSELEKLSSIKSNFEGEGRKLCLNPDYSFRPAEIKRHVFSDKKKDEAFFDVVIGMYEVSYKLVADFEDLADIGIKLSTPDLEDLMNRENLRKSHSTSIKSSFNVDSPESLARLASAVSSQEIHLSDEEVYFFDGMVYFAALKSLQKEFPEMLVNDDGKKAVGFLDGILKRILKDYPDGGPEVVFYGTAEEFKNNLKKEQNATACYNSIENKITSYPKEFRKMIDALAHEYGHAVSRISARKIEGKVDPYIEVLNGFKYAVQRKRDLISYLQFMKSVPSDERTFRSKLFMENFDKLKDDELQLNLQLISYRLDSTMELFDDRKTPVDEASAYLFRDIVFNEIAHDNPRLGELLINLSEMENKMRSSDAHYKGVLLADKLKKKHNGNALAAYRKLIAAPDSFESLVDGKSVLDNLTENINLNFVVSDKLEAAMKNIEDYFSNWGFVASKVRRQEVLSAEDKSLIEKRKQAFIENQKTLSSLYQKYLDYLKQN